MCKWDYNRCSYDDEPAYLTPLCEECPNYEPDVSKRLRYIEEEL